MPRSTVLESIIIKKTAEITRMQRNCWVTDNGIVAHLKKNVCVHKQPQKKLNRLKM